jgi:hypothetical protein
VGVHEVCVDPARGANEADEQRRHEQPEPGPPAQIAERAVPVGDAVMPKPLRPDDLDVNAARTNVFHRVSDEPSGCVPVEARVRRRQHCDAHQVPTRKTA